MKDVESCSSSSTCIGTVISSDAWVSDSSVVEGVRFVFDDTCDRRCLASNQNLGPTACLSGERRLSERSSKPFGVFCRSQLQTIVLAFRNFRWSFSLTIPIRISTNRRNFLLLSFFSEDSFVVLDIGVVSVDQYEEHECIDRLRVTLGKELSFSVSNEESTAIGGRCPWSTGTLLLCSGKNISIDGDASSGDMVGGFDILA